MCMKWQHTAKQILKVTTSLTLFTHVSMSCIYRTNTPAHAHMCPHTHTYGFNILQHVKAHAWTHTSAPTPHKHTLKTKIMIKKKCPPENKKIKQGKCEQTCQDLPSGCGWAGWLSSMSHAVNMVLSASGSAVALLLLSLIKLAPGHCIPRKLSH